MTDVAAQVPSRYDVVIDGHGYVFANTQQVRAKYSNTRTFLERTNVSGRYGDNEQEFYLTASQNDFSGGQGQRFLRVNDQASASRYYQGEADNIMVPGQVSVQTKLDTTIATSYATSAALGLGVFLDDKIAWVDTNNHLWTTLFGAGGTAVDIGAHGAGAANRWGMAVDPNHVYIAGASVVRSWNASSFATFANVSNAGSLTFLNNILYSCDGAILRSYDTAGAVTTEYIWKDAFGTTVTPSGTGIGCKIVPFGGKLLIFQRRGTAGRPELWLFDGFSTEMVGQLPESSLGYDMVVINGVAYLSGVLQEMTATGTMNAQPVIWYYLNGTLDELWRSKVTSGSTNIGDAAIWPALGSYQGRLLFVDYTRLQLMQYDPPTGAFSSIGLYSAGGGTPSTSYSMIASDRQFCGLFFNSAVPAFLIPSSGANIATTGYVTSSMIDFDNSLTKIFRGVKAEFTGSGTVSISYSVNTLDGTYTGLTSSATSGTEVLFPSNTTGIGVSLKFTLTPSGNNSPLLKRFYLRAVPVQQSFKTRQYVLDLTGRFDRGEENNPVRLRDGTDSTLTGAQMAANLNTAIASTAPVSITDRFGTYTAVFEQGAGVSDLQEVRPDEFIAVVTPREV